MKQICECGHAKCYHMFGKNRCQKLLQDGILRASWCDCNWFVKDKEVR